jgi:hypothetical protein
MCAVFNDGRLPSVLDDIKHGATTLLGLVFGKSFSNHPALSGLSRSFRVHHPAHEPYVELSWHLSQLLQYFVSLGDNNAALSYRDLMGKFVCLCMITAGMRLTEIQRLDLWSAEPTDNYWQTYTGIKKHDALSIVRLPRLPQKPSLDPVLTLINIRERHSARVKYPAGGRVGATAVVSYPNHATDRPNSNAMIRSGLLDERTGLNSNAMMRSGLLDERGTEYSAPQIRYLAKYTLRKAGIDDKRPDHIKHATVSYLYSLHLPPEVIAQFLR